MEEMDCDFAFESHHNVLSEFVIVTTTSEEFAKDYLNLYNWDIKAALNSFNDIQSDRCEQLSTFKVFSWNLDGLDKRHLDIRTNSVIKIILQINPEFVFLQELVSISEAKLRDSLSQSYHFFVDTQLDFYYCGILVKKHPSVRVDSELEVLKFKNSEMGRSLLMLMVDIGRVKVKLMTSHLESCRQSSELRKAQLASAFEQMKSAECCCIFAGDMNVRDIELRQLKGLPYGILDLGQLFANGENKALLTWEPIKNANISRELANVAGMRYDRMYVHLVGDTVSASKFELLGTDQLTECSLHTSDHWAILGSFSL